MKDKLIKAALSFAVVCVLGACTKNYLDINSNPYEVDKEQMEAKDYAIASGLSAMFGTVVSTDVNTAQFTDCLLGSTQGGYYADANNGWTNTISKYNPTDNWTNVFMYSDKVIPQLYSNMSNVEGISEDPLVLAILKIVKVCVLNRVTDTYGQCAAFVPGLRQGRQSALYGMHVQLPSWVGDGRRFACCSRHHLLHERL